MEQFLARDYRTVVHKQVFTPEFHQVDMMGVVHNSVYIQWFDASRNRLLLRVMNPQELLNRGFALPVVKNVCNHCGFMTFGDTAVITTRHKVYAAYQGTLVFHHSIVNKKDRKEVASGETVLAAVEWPSRRLIREVPVDLWDCYLKL